MNVPIIDEDAKEDRKRILVDYFTTNRHNHEFYAFRFFLCELLNFVNVLGQIFFMDMFLGGEFTTYGSDVVHMSEMEPGERSDPMSRVFPKVCKLFSLKYFLVKWHARKLRKYLAPKGEEGYISGGCLICILSITYNAFIGHL